jgi:hypothetical protein
MVESHIVLKNIFGENPLTNLVVRGKRENDNSKPFIKRAASGG